MSRALERLLRKLEETTAAPNDVRRLSDEELEARYARLLPKVLEGLAAGSEDDQRLGRALAGRSLQDLTPDAGRAPKDRFQRGRSREAPGG